MVGIDVVVYFTVLHVGFNRLPIRSNLLDKNIMLKINKSLLGIHFMLDLSMSQEDTMEETGWKLVHGDVFRPPKRAWLLTAFVGSGVQIFFMVLITLGKSSRDLQPNAGCNMHLRNF